MANSQMDLKNWNSADKITIELECIELIVAQLGVQCSMLGPPLSRQSIKDKLPVMDMSKRS